MSRDRAHMSAIGREGGHSRGARARAASQGGDSGDFARQTTGGNQAFAHEVTSERGGFEGSRAASSGTQRGNYSASDRGTREREERESDRESDHGPFSGRGQI